MGMFLNRIRYIETSVWSTGPFQVKDMTRRFNTLPPIAQGNKVKSNAMAFTIDWAPDLDCSCRNKPVWPTNKADGINEVL